MRQALHLLTVTFSLLAADAIAQPADYDPDGALRLSQAAIGNRLDDHAYTDVDGRLVRLTDFAGKPLLVNLIFTSCHHTCPLTTRHLDKAVSAARDALGRDSFHVVTVGFDSPHDTPDNMRAFARRQRVLKDGWSHLSAPAESSARLRELLGFSAYPSPRGFDHIVQVSVVDADSTVYAQVYGETFELPWLVEPLKELVFDRPRSSASVAAGLLDRIRFFCTVYDPSSGRYRFDYSLFIQIAVGFMVVASVAIYLVRETRRARRQR